MRTTAFSIPHSLFPISNDDLLVLVGPTASGKTELAIQIAQQIDGEIVSADSIQIYREFNIGSGKPTLDERNRAVHHLIDIVDPLAPIDAQKFAQMAEEVIADVQRRGKVPIVCGGTFLWVKALVWGLVPVKGADAEVRARHVAMAEAEGRGVLHARLAEVDPESAERLSPNDFVRVSRALEIYEVTGKRQSEWHSEHAFRQRRYKARFVGVPRERAELDQRIEARTKMWLDQGWVDEVKDLLCRGYGQTRAMGCVGYKQVREHLEGKIQLDALGEAIVRATRVFVRRQRTWLRDQEVTWVHPSG